MKIGPGKELFLFVHIYLKSRELTLKESEPVGVSLGTVLRLLSGWCFSIFPQSDKTGGMYK